MAMQYLFMLFLGCLFICLHNYILLPGITQSINVRKDRVVKDCSETHQANAMHCWQLQLCPYQNGEISSPHPSTASTI